MNYEQFVKPLTLNYTCVHDYYMNALLEVILRLKKCVEWRTYYWDLTHTCFPELIQCKAVDLKVSLEALLVNPGWQTSIFVLCRTKRRNLSEAQNWHSTHSLSILKAQHSSVLMPWIVRRSQCWPPVRSLGNKEWDSRSVTQQSDVVLTGRCFWVIQAFLVLKQPMDYGSDRAYRESIQT